MLMPTTMARRIVVSETASIGKFLDPLIPPPLSLEDKHLPAGRYLLLTF